MKLMKINLIKIKNSKHKQQWFKNNHQSFGCFVSHFILVMVLIPIINIMNFVALFPKIKGISIVGNIVTFMFEKKICKKTRMLFFIYFVLVFICSCLIPFWDYLFNSIHYLGVKKDAFAKEYGLVKEKACYFTYDRSTKRIINNQKYFMIPGLFINDYHSLTYNIFAFIFYLINIINVIVYSCYILCKINEYNEFYEKLWRSFRILILIILFIRLISLIELTFLHVLGENNPFHQLKVFYFNNIKFWLSIFNNIKPWPLIKDFYYYFDNKHFQKQTTTKLVSRLAPINWLIYGLLIIVIVLTIGTGLGIDFISWCIATGYKDAYYIGNKTCAYLLYYTKPSKSKGGSKGIELKKMMIQN